MRLSLILVMFGLIAAVWLFPMWYPILNQETISNPFPGLEESKWQDYLLLSTTEQEAFEFLRDGDDDEGIDPQPEAALALVRARLSPLTSAPADETTYTPPDGSSITRRGVWTTIDTLRSARGTVTIYQLPDQTRILRLEDFEMRPAPEVHLIFTRNPDPLDKRGVGVDYIDVGELKGMVGNQTYIVPQGVNFNTYPILVLYSVRHNLVISTATLR